jgi:tRNA threonylcarbamoyladenosine biosynthesis protein TsaE
LKKRTEKAKFTPMQKIVLWKKNSNSPETTWALAADLLQTLKPGSVLALHGDLGSGKTCFIQGLANALGVTDPVSSPTYTLIHEYTSGEMPLYHMDLYRLGDPEEAWGIGLDEYMEPDGITAIEWAERAGGLLPPGTLHLEFRHGANPEERIIRLFKEE